MSTRISTGTFALTRNAYISPCIIIIFRDISCCADGIANDTAVSSRKIIRDNLRINFSRETRAVAVRADLIKRDGIESRCG